MELHQHLSQNQKTYLLVAEIANAHEGKVHAAEQLI